jgi:hypothetical protein
MFNFWIYNSVLCSSAIPFFTFFVIQRKKVKFDAFFFFILFRLITDISCLIMENRVGNSNPVFHFTIPINFLFIMYLFNKEIKLSNSINVLFTIIAFFLFWLDLFITSSINEVNQFSVLFSYTIIAVFGWIYLYKCQFKKASKNFLIPISIYYTTLIFHALFEIEIENSETIYDFVFLLFAGLTLFLNLSFTRAIWLTKIN